jgi:hypothetical protein
MGCAMLCSGTTMVTFKQGVENHMPLIHHLLKVKNISSFSSHFSIALDNLKSLYISHLISPTRLLLSVK